jgi:enoyl-CoA hydratase/carnithine racemase
MNEEAHVLVNDKDKVRTITWNRIEKKNALTQNMYGIAADALTDAENNNNIRVVVLTGTRECFTSGNDLNDFLDSPPDDEETPVARFLAVIARFKKPLIAAVNGPAIGVGTTMLLHCDLVVAADTTVFSLPFVKLGLCPEAASSYLLPLLAGHQRAAELLMLGDNFGAEMARDCGLVNRIGSEDEYQEMALDLAHKLAALPPNSVQTTKALLRNRHAAEIETAMATEFDKFASMLSSPEAIEAMTAFMERRTPDFSKS